MTRALVAAVLVSFLWIVAQNVWMRIAPTPRRLRSMTCWFLASLPCLALAWLVLPIHVPAGESPLLGPVNGIVLHTLVFFCYAECFYHVERSVTLRLLVELLPHGDAGTTEADLTRSYPQEDMVVRRLEVLRDNMFVADDSDGWRLSTKGRVYAAVVSALAWIFQSRTQAERG